MKWYEKQKGQFRQQEEPAFDNTQESQDVEEVVKEESREQLPTVEDIKIEEMLDTTVVKQEETTIETSTTTISKGTVLQGDLTIRGNLHVSGNIIGTIQCLGELHADGCIEGNISAKSIHLEHAVITGDITCAETIEVLDDSKVTGNLHCEELICEGVIKGDIYAKNEIHLLYSSSIQGNVETRYLQTERGALLKGQYQVISD